ncbi:hypothetical protein Scep_008471 [Stephania cephalantha]|uniref:Uncharacterized protein n=1 Tax=Stephania cephalantha TaxID=152367 RepID=A0AAP0KDU2_9MAGN
MSLRASRHRRKWKGSKEDGFRKKEKKLKGDKKFDKGGKMSSKGEGAKEKWLAVRLTLLLERSLKQAYALPLQIQREILFAAIQTESRHGNKKESNIPMARREDFVRGSKRFTNLSKLTHEERLSRQVQGFDQCEN